MKTLCFTLNLKSNESLVQEYIAHHQRVWPEVLDSIKSNGIISMEIYHYQTRLFMRIETEDDFSLEEKSKADANNHKIQEWEDLMWNYQSKIEGSAPNEKWVQMDKIFDLKDAEKLHL